jgi:hypothetical protein
MVFLPLIQDDVDRHNSAWNNHRLRKISENGRDIPSHVPGVRVPEGLVETTHGHGRRQCALHTICNLADITGAGNRTTIGRQ